MAAVVVVASSSSAMSSDMFVPPPYPYSAGTSSTPPSSGPPPTPPMSSCTRFGSGHMSIFDRTVTCGISSRTMADRTANVPATNLAGSATNCASSR